MIELLKLSVCLSILLLPRVLGILKITVSYVGLREVLLPLEK